MKKNKIKNLIIICLIVTCTACNGDITREIRHDGFTYNGDFICQDFYPKDKNDDSYKKIKFLADNNIIDNEGSVYEITLSKLYSDDSNCKKINTNFLVKSILDGNIAKGTDNKLYYLKALNNSPSYTEILPNDDKYTTYSLLLSPEDIIKVISGKDGIYYVLKSDGNVYKYVIGKTAENTPEVILSIELFLDKNNYGGEILNFNYVENSSKTFVKTKDKYYKLYKVNKKKCEKYDDVECKYKIKKDKSLTENYDKIFAYNGDNLITSYKKKFTSSE